MGQPEQPNFQAIVRGLESVAGELTKFANLPAVAGLDRLLHTMDEQYQSLSARLDMIQGVVVQTHALQREALSTWQLRNALASLEAPLRYPQHVTVLDHFPTCKADFIDIRATTCQEVAQAIGLAPFSHEATDEQRRDQIKDALCAW